MKKLIILTFTILLLTLNPAKPQSPPAWGFAPQLITTANGGDLTYRVTNYITHTSPTNIVLYSGNRVESEGIGVYSDFSGNCFAMIYDPMATATGAFKPFYMGSSSYAMNLGANSGVAYYSNQFEFNAATYNPFTQSWKEIYIGTSLSLAHVEDGMVLLRYDSNRLTIAIFDPIIGDWVNKTIDASGYQTLQVETNIALFVSNSNTATALAYDFEDHNWHSFNLGYHPAIIEMEGGVISYVLAGKKVCGAVYDFSATNLPCNATIQRAEGSFSSNGDSITIVLLTSGLSSNYNTMVYARQ